MKTINLLATIFSLSLPVSILAAPTSSPAPEKGAAGDLSCTVEGSIPGRDFFYIVGTTVSESDGELLGMDTPPAITIIENNVVRLENEELRFKGISPLGESLWSLEAAQFGLEIAISPITLDGAGFKVAHRLLPGVEIVEKAACQVTPAH